MAAALNVDPEFAQRLARLESIEEVRATVAAYCRVIDQTRSTEELAELFAPEAVLRNPTKYQGRDAILDYYRSFFESGVGITRHHIVNDTVTLLEDERAAFSAYFLVLLARDGISFVGFGNYEDRLEHDGERWRFAEKGNEVLRMVPFDEGWQ